MEARTNIEIYERDYLLSCHYGDYKRALELAEKLYSARCEIFGTDSPEAEETLKLLNEINTKIEENP